MLHTVEPPEQAGGRNRAGEAAPGQEEDRAGEAAPPGQEVDSTDSSAALLVADGGVDKAS